jgi:hypothetical protein
MYQDDEYDFYENEEYEIKRDNKIDEAKEDLIRFFNERGNDVYYMRQLEVFFEDIFFEKKYYHWITGKAINELISERVLSSLVEELIGPTRVKFVFNKKHRYYKRQINEKLKVVREYSQPNIAIACGRQAEIMFLNALVVKGFKVIGENINEY